MKAIVYERYGSPEVLELREIERPAPEDDEVLIRIHAASVNAADLHYLRADPFLIRFSSGLLKPKNRILGADVAGRVEAIGGGVTRFKPGDEVFGDISACGWGGFAEYVCARENALIPKPINLTFEQAAAVPMAAITALQGLRDEGRIRRGQNVLINGASGGVGTFAVQIAKAFGAEVTGVCSTAKMKMVRSIGADHVIDYTHQDFTRNGQRYDLILAANGNRSIWEYRDALGPEGTYVMTGGSRTQMFQAMLFGRSMSKPGGRTMGNALGRPDRADLAFMKELLEAGKVVPVMDKCYLLSEAADAFRYLEEGHAMGKVVITPEHANATRERGQR